MSVGSGPAAGAPGSIHKAIGYGTLVALVVFAALVSGGRPSGLLEHGPYTSDFYDAQARSLLDGRLDVDRSLAGIEGFERDGRTYLYFGLVPALLRVPVVALTSDYDGRLTQLSMLLALALATVAAGRVAWRARTAWRGHGSATRREAWAVGAFTAAVGASSPLLFLATRPLVYHEAQLWGVALAILAGERLLAWWQEPSHRTLLLASIAAGLALNARPSVGGGALAALGLALLARARSDGLAITVRRSMAVLAPLLVYSSINYARFEHPVSVPFDIQRLAEYDEVRQAALAETDGSLFGPQYAPTAAWAYLRPDGIRLQRLFPWVTYRESTGVIGDATFDTIDRTASLPVAAPALGLLGAVGVVSLLGRRHRSRAPWVALIGGSATGIVLTVTIGFIAHRYLSDFVPVVVAAGAWGLWAGAERAAAWGRGARRYATAALGALVLLGLVLEGALSLQSQRLLILPEREARRDFVALQYRLADAIGDVPTAEVSRDRDLSQVPARGQIGVVGDCEALYWSDGRSWFPLELGKARGFQLEGELADGRTTVLRGPAWTVVADATGGTVRFSYLREGGDSRRGPDVRRQDLQGEAIEVRLDLVAPELVLRAGGRDVLRAWLVDLGGPVETDASLDATALGTPLCDRLARDLDQSAAPRAGSSS